jgi:hypothetical protein
MLEHHHGLGIDDNAALLLVISLLFFGAYPCVDCALAHLLLPLLLLLLPLQACFSSALIIGVLKDGLGMDGTASLLQASNSVPTPKGTSVEVRHVFGQKNPIVERWLPASAVVRYCEQQRRQQQQQLFARTSLIVLGVSSRNVPLFEVTNGTTPARLQPSKAT